MKTSRMKTNMMAENKHDENKHDGREQVMAENKKSKPSAKLQMMQEPSAAPSAAARQGTRPPPPSHPHSQGRVLTASPAPKTRPPRSSQATRQHLVASGQSKPWQQQLRPQSGMMRRHVQQS
jgi:hypothetical protein